MLAATRPETGPDLAASAGAATAMAEALLADATRAVAARVTQNGKVSGKLLDREQRAAHGLSWFATYVEAIRQLASYTERMSAAGRFGELEELLVRIGLGEYLAQMTGGIPMSQGEFVRPADLGLGPKEIAARVTPEVDELIATGNTAQNRARLIALMREHHGATVGDCGLEDTY
jgi:(2S)-methylsuccinyl-CoA dehydrogenase